MWFAKFREPGEGNTNRLMELLNEGSRQTQLELTTKVGNNNHRTVTRYLKTQKLHSIRHKCPLQFWQHFNGNGKKITYRKIDGGYGLFFDLESQFF